MTRNHNYKGGTISQHGYKLIYVGKEHHLADVRGYAYEHRLVAEKKIGRRLKPKEQVHHIDGDKLNNEPVNLEVMKSMKHHHLHHRKKDNNLQHPDEDNVLVKCKCGCGQSFLKYDSEGRRKQYVPGHNPQNNFTERYILDNLSTGPKTISYLIANYSGGKSIKTIVSKLCKMGKISRVSKGVYSKSNQ